MTSRSSAPVVSLFVAALALAAVPAGALTTGRIADCSVDGDRVTITLEAAAYELIETPAGQRLTMDGFDALQVPGRPRLPVKRFLVALPPGTRATSIEILEVETFTLPGTYRLEPAPSIVMLPGMPGRDEAMQRLAREWDDEHGATYGAGGSLPAAPAWISASGTSRKVSYAAVAFCPFTYDPRSGRLDHHPAIRVAIHCESLASSGREAEIVARMLDDRVGEAKASRLFSNYAEVADLYAGGAGDASDTRDGRAASSAPRRDDIHDYVIITTPALRGAISVSGFEAWKASCGYSVRTVLTTDPEITGQPGLDLAARIRNFLRAHYAVWGIEYVLLVGDYATVPMRICYPDPEYHVYNPGNPGLVAPGTPTDYYYADLSFDDAISWDADGDGYFGEYGDDLPDFLAEVAVGRIPVNQTTRIIYALDKLAAFEEDTGAWKQSVLNAGSILFFENQDHHGYPFVDGSTCLDSMETGLMGGRTITHFTEREGLVTSYFDWPAISEASFTASWGGGAHAIVNWSGHGWSDGAYRTVWMWDDGDNVPESSNGELESRRFIGLGAANLDDDHPSVVFAISCNVGFPDPNPYGNLGIDLLTLPGWGASSGIVSSARPAAVSGDWKHDPGGTEQICFDFNRYLVVEGARVGDALYDGKFDATTAYGWDLVYEYMNLYNFNLYGDPSLDLDGGGTVGVAAADGRARPAALTLLPGAPNPFAATTTLRLLVPAPGLVRVTVHDVAGRQVATLAGGHRQAGELVLGWDGRGEDGARLGSGTYFVRVETAGGTLARKIVVVR